MWLVEHTRYDKELVTDDQFLERIRKTTISHAFHIHTLNNCMETLHEIRRRLVSEEPAHATLKAATRTWLAGLARDYPLALTLTLRQSVRVMTPRGLHIHALRREDVERTAQRFIKKLNREVYGRRAADKHGKGLRYIVVMEGERSSKNLHLHVAVGGMPAHCNVKRFEALVQEAKAQVPQLHEQYWVDIADSGWMEYICKELGARDTDNVLWNVH